MTMMTNRSNHMPTLTRIERMKTTSMLVRIFLNQKNCGTSTLQDDHDPLGPPIRRRLDVQSGPMMNGSAARLWKNMNCS